MIVRVKYNLVLLYLCLTIIVIKVGYKCYLYNLTSSSSWWARRLTPLVPWLIAWPWPDCYWVTHWQATIQVQVRTQTCKSMSIDWALSELSTRSLPQRQVQLITKPYSSWRSSLTFSRAVNNGGFTHDSESVLCRSLTRSWSRWLVIIVMTLVITAVMTSVQGPIMFPCWDLMLSCWVRYSYSKIQNKFHAIRNQNRTCSVVLSTSIIFAICVQIQKLIELEFFIKRVFLCTSNSSRPMCIENLS